MNALKRCERLFVAVDPWTQSMFLAAARGYLAWVFLRAGLVKIQAWGSTLMLFEYEYSVPFLSPAVAAYLATAAELVLPVLLIAGMATRVSAIALLVLNVVAAISYPDISPAGMKDHVLWSWLCVVLIVFGPGRLALDAWLGRRSSAYNLAPQAGAPAH